MDKNKLYFITGSQDLYGEAVLRTVARNAQEVVEGLNSSHAISAEIVWQPTVRTAAEIINAIRAANCDDDCIGVICWMHTFSPAKMWINGLKLLQKPLLHFATQHNQLLPWESIDMDFMNLNQAAHGDREFGYICTRLDLPRKVVVGFWRDPAALAEIDVWTRAAAGLREAKTLRVARLGDNMRDVAVTEGDKVSAQIEFGFTVNTYGVGDAVEFIRSVADREVDQLVKEYAELYCVKAKSAAAAAAIREAARQEIGLRAFLASVGAKAFTTTFEDLHGLAQLPGLAAQRLMADGFGFGAEGDWKTAAMLRIAKVMAAGRKGGTSFMEDYTYHLEAGRERVLGSHMLEVCPSIAAGKPSLEVHALGIGGKGDPARLVFDSPAGPALNASLIDLGDRFRLIVNQVEAVKPDRKLPKLPVARTVWVPKPDFHTGVRSWIEAGGAHHAVYSQALEVGHLIDFAELTGIECVVIG
ncbi:MAG: L-arabinose isomerase [Victivallaceae bacterium]